MRTCSAVSTPSATTVMPRLSASAITADTIAPDLILLDVHMPALDGYAVCRHVRARADGAAPSFDGARCTHMADRVIADLRRKNFFGK